MALQGSLKRVWFLPLGEKNLNNLMELRWALVMNEILLHGFGLAAI